MGKVSGNIWGLLTSLWVAVVLILVLAVFAIVGALVPQGMEEDFYLKAWDRGTYETLRDLGVLNIYKSALFIAPAILLALNLLCCCINVLRRFAPEGITGRNVISALYHLAMLAMFVGFFTTFLVSWGGDLTIKPGEAVAVPTKAGETNWAKLAPRLGLAPPADGETPFTLRLNKFETTYVERGGKVYVKDWISDLSVLEDGVEVRRKRIEVNRPLVWGGMKFYQAFYEQRIRFTVDGQPQELGMGEPLTLGDGMMMVAPVKAGMLLEPAPPKPLGPYVELKEMPKDKWHRVAKDVRPGTKLALGVPVAVKGHAVVFVGFDEASGLTYKRDPAVKYLWILWLAFTALIGMRIYFQESLFLWFGKKPK